MDVGGAGWRLGNRAMKQLYFNFRRKQRYFIYREEVLRCNKIKFIYLFAVFKMTRKQGSTRRASILLTCKGTIEDKFDKVKRTLVLGNLSAR